jgi:hypothetical protein
MDEIQPTYAYMGHMMRIPSRVAVVVATSLPDALKACEAVGQPDRASFQAVEDPLTLRFRANLAVDKGSEGTFHVQLEPQPDGALVHNRLALLHSDDLVRLNGCVRAAAAGGPETHPPVCSRCGYPHHPNMACHGYLPVHHRLVTYFGIINSNPHHAFLRIAHHGFSNAASFGALPPGLSGHILGAVQAGAVFSFDMDQTGLLRSSPDVVCHTQSRQWLEPLERLLAKHGHLGFGP